ncbi:MAG: GNAT family N-acetyltransferase [Pseudomonadota bacterium]
MRCHPAFQGVDIPKSALLGPYRLEVLGPEAVEEDYAAVMESKDRLRGLMGGDWPAGLTLEENGIDLAWHLKEFLMKRSFAWIVRDEAASYIGCLYVFPRFMEQAADVWVWARSSLDAVAHEAAIAGDVGEWLAGPNWPDLAYRLNYPGAR